MSFRSRLSAWIPPAVQAARRRARGCSLRFDDAPGNWAQAVRQSSGYDADLILQSVLAATREVVAGRALFERDSVLFDQPEFNFPIVAALMRSAALNGGALEVIDFGGSLGSTYRQCRPFLAGLRQVRWRIVEQAHFVQAGRAEFETAELSFHTDLADLPPSSQPRLALLSSVVQYLEQPESVLAGLLALSPSHLVIDRTPLSTLNEHKLTIQHAPRAVYDASYPCWILSRPALLARLAASGWRVVAEFPSPEGAFATPRGLTFSFGGLIAESPTRPVTP